MTAAPRAALVAFLCTLPTFLGGCIEYLQPSFKSEQSLEAPAKADAPLSVKARNGGVSITANPSATKTSIHATISALSQERANAAKIHASPADNGTFSISVAWPDGKEQMGDAVSFDIVVPGAKGVTVNTSNGHVNLTALSGKALVDTSNGPITVNHHSGDVVLNTSNGPVDVDAVTGTIDIKTSNASLNLIAIANRVTAKTSNASVTASLAPTATGPIDLHTSNGPMDIRLSPAFKGTLSASTSNGNVHLPTDFGTVSKNMKTSAQLQVGDGPASTLSTSNGPITVSKG